MKRLCSHSNNVLCTWEKYKKVDVEVSFVTWQTWAASPAENCSCPCFPKCQISGEWLGNRSQLRALAQAAEGDGSSFQPNVRQTSVCCFYCIFMILTLVGPFFFFNLYLERENQFIVKIVFYIECNTLIPWLIQPDRIFSCGSDTHTNSVMAERSQECADGCFIPFENRPQIFVVDKPNHSPVWVTPCGRQSLINKLGLGLVCLWVPVRSRHIAFRVWRFVHLPQHAQAKALCHGSCYLRGRVELGFYKRSLAHFMLVFLKY